MPLPSINTLDAIRDMPVGTRFTHKSLMGDPESASSLRFFYEKQENGTMTEYDRIDGRWVAQGHNLRPGAFGWYYPYTVLRYGTELEHYAID